jgi:hypothetical protein
MGEDTYGQLPPASGGDGNDALVVSASRVALYQTTLRGGTAGDNEDCPAIHGSHAGRACVLDGTLFAVGSSFHGGDGAAGAGFTTCGGAGADALVLQANSRAYLSSNSYDGGHGGVGFVVGIGTCHGPDGVGISGSWADLQFFNYTPALFSGISVHTGLNPFLVNVGGTPGSLVSLGQADHSVWSLALPQESVRLLPMPLLFAFPPASIPGSGTLDPLLDMPVLPPSIEFQRVYAQGAFLAAPTDPSRFGNPLGILVLSRNAPPDCDGDGLNDYVEVIENPSLDMNHNLIPDSCPGG